MRIFGLIGEKLAHSFSADYFKNKFETENINDAIYNLFPIPHPNNIQNLVAQLPELKGLNVTIPYKKSIIPYLDAVDDMALLIGAVNTIKISHKNGKPFLKGFNTDYYAFLDCLNALPLPSLYNALVLGTGGASAAVCAALKNQKVPFTRVSRTQKGNAITYADIDKELIMNHFLIINTTPLGMFPDIDTCPNIPYEHLTENHILFDLVYNPQNTLFLEKGLQKKTYICNGLNMLYVQAEHAWHIWNDETY